MDWFSLSLLCALSLALADVFTKKHLVGFSGGQLLVVRFALSGLLLLPWFFFYPLPALPLVFWWWMVLLVPLELLAMVIYMRAIRDAPLSETLPYLSFTPVFNIATGWLILGETISWLGAGGILLVVFGSYLLNIHQLNGRGKRLWLEPLRTIFTQQASRRMLFVAFIYSITSVLGKGAMQYTTPESFGAFYFVVLGGAALILVALHRPTDLRVFHQGLLWPLLVAGMMAVMVVTHFVALSMVETAYMITVKRLSLLFGILLGAWLLKESGLGRSLIGAGTMVLGVALILLG